MESISGKGSKHGTPLKWAHLVAVGGTGMGALAGLLQDLGYFVSGSDNPLYPPMSTFLAQKKIPIKTGYAASNIEASSWSSEEGFPQGKKLPDLVVIGNAISRGNAEAQAVDTLITAHPEILRMSFAQALAEYAICDKRSFVVAGTHGKTTTTSLLAWAFQSLGKNPGYFIGGIPKNFDSGCSSSNETKVFVSEGDEYDTAYWDKESKFLHYRPSWVLCTGIEFDHADIFPNVEAITKSFVKLVGKTREGWILIDNESAPRADTVSDVARALFEKKIACKRYGVSANSEYRLLSDEACELPWKSGTRGTRIVMKCPELGQIEFVSTMAGRHNALNTIGDVAVLLASCEISTLVQIQDFLKTFEGIKRRQEEVFSSRQRVVIDDFAHHPTAIRETIRAIRGRYPNAYVAAFFEARSATSARNILAHEFAASFDDADAIFLSPPTKTNIPESEKLDMRALAQEIAERPANRGGKTFVLESRSEDLARAYLEWSGSLPVGSRSVALVMSNGPFGGIHSMLK